MPEARINVYYPDQETIDKLRLQWLSTKREHGLKWGAWLLYPRIKELEEQQK